MSPELVENRDRSKLRSYLDQVYTVRHLEELKCIYDNWASKYDAHSVLRAASQPAAVGEMVERIAPRSARILDVGAGTGALGRLLGTAGYDRIDALDLSEGMLDVARRADVYQNYYQRCLGGPLDFEDGSFECIVGAGIFTEKHAPISSFNELSRILDVGGHLIFSVNTKLEQSTEFIEKFQSLAQSDNLRLIAKSSTPFAMMRQDFSNSFAIVLAYQKKS